MNAVPEEVSGLARRWVVEYNRFVFLVLSLREFTRNRWQPGMLQELVTEAARAVVETGDQLRALGHPPYLQLAGEEASLWTRAVSYTHSIPWTLPPAHLPAAALLEDLERLQREWALFASFVADLSDEFFATAPALSPTAMRPEGRALLLGPRRCAPAPGYQGFGQPAGEVGDEPLIR